MVDDVATTWGGKITLGRAPANNEILLGDANGNFTLTPSSSISPSIQTLLDGISNTQGSILYRSASAWSALAPGTSGYFLKTNGAGANPTWASTSSAAGPAFSAYKSTNQSVVSGYQKLVFDTEEFDTNSCFASNRFTPNVAGYYMITAAATYDSSYEDYPTISIYKNGSIFKEVYSSYYYGQGLIISSLISMNGTTDYVEAYWYSPGSNTLRGTQQTQYFQGFLARSA
jgi:hypothetical protein